MAVVLVGLAMIGASYRLFVMVFYNGNYTETLVMSGAVSVAAAGGIIVVTLGLILREITLSRLAVERSRAAIKADASSSAQ